MLGMIRTTKERVDLLDARKDFIGLARLIALSKGRVVEARALAGAEKASARLQRIVEKAEPGMIGAVGGSPQTWGSHLGDYAQVEQAFAVSLQHSGAFDRMLPDTIAVPLRTRIAVSTAAIVAEEVAEAAPKPVHDLDIAGDTLDPKKVAGVVVLTQELLRAGGPAVERLLDRELRAAIVAGTDALVLADLIALTSPIASSGNVLEDLATALAAINIGSDSKLFFIARPEDVSQLAVTPGIVGPAFVGLGVNGGAISGIQVLVSNALADGKALLVDATQLLTGVEPIRLDSSAHGLIDMAGGSAPTFSLWQKDSVALRAERMLAVHALRASAVQSFSNVSYSGGSPA